MAHNSRPLSRHVITFDTAPRRRRLAIHDARALHFQMLFPAAALRRRVAEEFGAVDGLHQTLGRLEALLETGVQA